MAFPQHFFPLILADHTSPYSVRRLVVQIVVYQTEGLAADSQPLPFRLRQLLGWKPVVEKIYYILGPLWPVLLASVGLFLSKLTGLELRPSPPLELTAAAVAVIEPVVITLSLRLDRYRLHG
jgi:hypothetical protein